MNTRSFERQLQQLDPPRPDPRARFDARRLAVAEFEQLQAERRHESAPARASRGWSWKAPWIGGFATACLAVVGVSIYWLLPEEQREANLAATAADPAALRAMAGQPAPETSVTADAAGAAMVAPVAQSTAPAEAAPRPATRAMEPAQAPAPRTPDNQSLAEIPPQPALKAQEHEAEDSLGQVMITGARIQSPGTPGAPITTLTGEEMRRLGMVNTADAVTRLVPAPSSAITAINTPVPSQPVAGQARTREEAFVGNTIANLRGMDPAFGSRTLTLVDGRRVVAPPTNDRFTQFETNPALRAAEQPVSTFSVDVDTTSYSFTRRMLNGGSLPDPDAVRVEEMINYFDYAWPAPESRERPFRPTVTVSDSPWGEGRKLVHIGIKGYELPVRAQPDVNLVLLIDVSGSMNQPDKLPLARRSMHLLLDSLKPTDTVAIVVYAGAAGQVLPPTPVRNREAIEGALDSLTPGGSTAGARGIQLAYDLAGRSFREGGVNRIILATDGDFNVGTSSTSELKSLVERERGRGIYLSVLGFGQGNYRDDIAQTLAQNGNGVAAYIDTLQEARKVLVREATSSLFTIASDVKIQVEFNPASVAEYRLVGYETRALNREDFNNDQVDAGDVGSGRTVTAIYEIVPVGSRATLLDELRYGNQAARPGDGGRARGNEYGFVKIRYKLPGETQSRLLEQPIRVDAGVPRALRQDVAFSTAVAGFGQLLRGGQYTGSLRYDDVIRAARDATGDDPHGYRAEFIELVRAARALRQPEARPLF